MHTHHFRTALLIPSMLLLIALMVFPGCASTGDADSAQLDGGYLFGNTFSKDIETVSVPIFDNHTLYTGVERDVTDAVIKEIQSRTPYVVIPSASADTILSGTIVHVTKNKMSELRGSGLVEDVIFSIAVDFEWKDLRTGKVLAARRNFEASEVYFPASPVRESQEIGAFAASAELARDLVSTMRNDW